MKKMNKRILAMLLAIVTIVSLFPLTVFADESTDEGTTPEHVTITVNFVYARNNAMVSAPWSAQLGDDGNLPETVVQIPSAEGYGAPMDKVVYSVQDDAVTVSFSKDAKDNIAGMTIKAENLTQDISITLFYVGEDVKYIVNHLQQKLENNEYTIIDKTEIIGAIDYIPEIEPNDYEGFYYARRSDTVDEDGVTHVNFLYDRERYLVTFDANGGVNAPDPMYVKYGTSIDIESLPEPTRGSYYEFAGWYIGNDRYYLIDSVSSDITLTAKWDSDNTSARVTYIMWGENAEGTGYDYIDTFSGEEYMGTVGNEITFATKICELEEHVHDASCATCDDKESNHEHTVDCYSCVTHGDEHIGFCYPLSLDVGDAVVDIVYYKYYDENKELSYKPGSYAYLELAVLDVLANAGDTSSPSEEFGKYTVYRNGLVLSSDNCFGTSQYEDGVKGLLWLNGVWFLIDLEKDAKDKAASLSFYCSSHDSYETCNDYCATNSKVRANSGEFIFRGTEYLTYKSYFDGSKIVADFCYTLLDNMKADKEYGEFIRSSNGELWTNTGGSVLFLKKLNGKWWRVIPQGITYKQYYGQYNIPDCPLSAHTHGDGSCTYDCGLHAHSDSCYSTCLKDYHKHGNECYSEEKFSFDENLWVFKEATTEEVEADESTVINAYFDRTYKTIEFYWDPTYIDWDQDVYAGWQYSHAITAKWGTNIGSQWLAVSNDAHRSQWFARADGGGEATGYLELMPKENRNYYCHFDLSTYTQRARYYTQELDSDEYKLAFTVTAYSYYDLYISQVDIYPMNGFSCETVINGDGQEYTAEYILDSGSNDDRFGKYDGSRFYYNRKDNTLILHSPNASTVYGSYQVTYGKNLADYYVVPEVTAEVKAYYGEKPVFLGWYKNSECTGEVFDFTAYNMPDATVALYAKWVEGVYSVRTYIDENCETLYTYEGYTGQQLNIPINEYAIAPVAPEKDNMVFVGWVYKDDKGVEHFFTFDMPITKDYSLYPKFSDNVAVDYVIHYYKTGTTEKVADDVTGSAQIGTTVKASAKLGDDLFEAYRSGYYPNKISISQVLTKDNMEIIFFYGPADEFQYTVRYVRVKEVVNDVPVYENLIDPVVKKDVTSSVVTEKYEPIEGYSPVQYSIQMNLTTNPEENIITFVYNKVTKINYAVVGDHVNTVSPTEESVLNNDPAKGATATPAENYRLVGWFDNQACTGEPLSTELTFVPEKDADGNYAETYYAKFVQTATVKVYHLYYTNSIHSVLGTEVFTADVDSGFKPEYSSFEGYAPFDLGLGYGGYSEDIVDPTGFEFTWDSAINSLESEITVPSNGLTIGLYYRIGEEDVTITYQQDKAGEVSKLGEETIKESSGTPAGKTAVNIEGYQFLGWFDEAGNQVGTTAEFVPAKNDEGKYEAATYTAKYDKLVTINYVAVGNGTVTPISETFAELSGAPKGSKAEIVAGHHFVGWFTDEECEGEPVSKNAEFVPTPVDGEYEAKYYAKFEVNTLTITKTGGIAGEQYIMRVVGTDRIINVVIGSGESATITAIPEGTYTIREDAKWSWRCKASDVTVTIGEGNYNASAEVQNSVTNTWWLNAVAFKDNKFNKK